MRFLLDTNVISELRKLRPHEAVRRWYSTYPDSAFALPSISIYELQTGAEVTRLQDQQKAEELDRWIQALLHETTVLPFDAPAARRTALLLHRKSKQLMEDAMIAAIADVHGLTVATRNVRDFEMLEVPVFNPFSFGG